MLECQETVKEEELFNKYVGNTKKMLRLKNVCKSDDICMREMNSNVTCISKSTS